MKNEITHPLERYKRIADPTIRQQCIDNFDWRFYTKYINDCDGGDISDAIFYGLDWDNTPEGYDYWDKIHNDAINGTLELLPEPVEEPSVAELKNSMREPYLEIDQLRSENEKLRECLRFFALLNESEPQYATIIGGIKQAKQLLNK